MSYLTHLEKDDSLDAARQEEKDLEMTMYDFEDPTSNESGNDEDDEEDEDNEENEEVDPADETDLPEYWDDDADVREYPGD